jgi:hypothetical protein
MRMEDREATVDGIYLRILVHANEHLCPDACNLAPVVNQGVLLLLCGGSSKYFFIGSEIS